jgi:hypothetical protein
MHLSTRDTSVYLDTPEGEVGVAEGGADDLDADLVGFGWINDDLLDDERRAISSAHRRCLASSWNNKN